MTNQQIENALNLGGIGMPMVDFFAPTLQELEDGEKLLSVLTTRKLSGSSGEKNQELIRDLQQNGLERIERAKIALKAFHAFVEEYERKNGDGAKPTLTEDEAIDIAQLFDTMLRGATDIKRAAVLLGVPDKGLDIRGAGGTTANKLHGIQSGMGSSVQTHMLGIIGQEDQYQNRADLLAKLDNSHIEFQHFKDAIMQRCATGYILQKDGDRIAFKGHIPPLKEILNESHHQQIRDFCNQMDAYIVESGDFSDAKLGDKAFDIFEKTVIDSGKPIFMGLPTDKKLVLGTSPQIQANRERVMRLVNAPGTAIIGANEEEAVAFFLNETLDKKACPGGLKNNPQIKRALEAAQATLSAKYEHMPKSAPEPICLISIGAEGAFAVTPSQIVFDPSIPVCEKNKVNNLGAGDAFFSGNVISYIRNVLQPLHQRLSVNSVHSEAFLQQMLQTGQKLGASTIQYKGAQLPPARIMELVHGAVPIQGELAEPTKLPPIERRIG